MATDPEADLTAWVEEAGHLLATDPTSAEGLARKVLQRSPRDPRAALILASARRRLGDPSGALAILKPLSRAYPNAVNTLYELGLALDAQGEAAAGIAALRRAVALNPDHADAWGAIGDALFRLGDIAGADEAFARRRRASLSDTELRLAADALWAGRAVEAEAILTRRLAEASRDLDAALLLAEAFARQGRHRDAARLLVTALDIDPKFEAARLALAEALFQQQKAEPALEQAEKLLASAPGNPVFRNLLAACLGLLGDFERAIELHQGLAAEFPKQAKIWLNYAHALRTVGRQEAAVEAYRRCIGLAPTLGDAWWGLANLKVAKFTHDETRAMAALLWRQDLPNDDRLHLDYALGKALEDRGDFEASFARYAEGARLRRASLPHDADEVSAHVDRSIELFTRAFFDERSSWGAKTGDPIFIVGLPRSGSTLIEQVLASHSRAEGTMELPDIALMAGELIAEGDYPGGLASIGPERAEALGQSYLATTRIQRREGRAHFIDKAPNNFLHIGLIRLILPKAKVIDARRHPMAACFSAYKQHFAQGQGFSYDLDDLGRYYGDYVRLMDHFDEVQPGWVHRVIYEDLVEDPEGEIRSLLDHCGLPFEVDCLDFWKNPRAVRTVSSEQVRQPIFREGLDRWRAFEPWLGPLQAALDRTLGPEPDAWRGRLSR